MENIIHYYYYQSEGGEDSSQGGEDPPPLPHTRKYPGNYYYLKEWDSTPSYLDRGSIAWSRGEVEVALLYDGHLVDHLDRSQRSEVEGDEGVGEWVEVGQGECHHCSQQQQPVRSTHLRDGCSKEDQGDDFVQVQL